MTTQLSSRNLYFQILTLALSVFIQSVSFGARDLAKVLFQRENTQTAGNET